MTSVTISQEQHALARERVRAAGLERPGRHPAARLPRHRRARTTRSSRSRCSRRSAPSTSRRSSRSAIAALVPGGRLSLQSSRSPMPPTSASSAARTGSRRTSSRAACARRWPSSSGRPRDTRLLVTRRHRHRRRTTSGRCVRGGRGSWSRLGDGARDGLRRPLHPDVGVLPRAERGGLRDRDQPGPPDRASRSAAAIAG